MILPFVFFCSFCLVDRCVVVLVYHWRHRNFYVLIFVIIVCVCVQNANDTVKKENICLFLYEYSNEHCFIFIWFLLFLFLSFWLRELSVPPQIHSASKRIFGRWFVICGNVKAAHSRWWIIIVFHLRSLFSRNKWLEPRTSRTFAFCVRLLLLLFGPKTVQSEMREWEMFGTFSSFLSPLPLCWLQICSDWLGVAIISILVCIHENEGISYRLVWSAEAQFMCVKMQHTHTQIDRDNFRFPHSMELFRTGVWCWVFSPVLFIAGSSRIAIYYVGHCVNN